MRVIPVARMVGLIDVILGFVLTQITWVLITLFDSPHLFILIFVSSNPF